MHTDYTTHLLTHPHNHTRIHTHMHNTQLTYIYILMCTLTCKYLYITKYKQREISTYDQHHRSSGGSRREGRRIEDLAGEDAGVLTLTGGGDRGSYKLPE